MNIVCDLETSGSDPIRNGVISASILITDNNSNVVKEFFSYVCPPELSKRTWSLDAQGVHGITFEQVQTFTPNHIFCYNLLVFLSEFKDHFPLNFICHASPNGWFDNTTKTWKIIKWFDYFFLEWCFRKAKFENGSDMVWTMWKAFNEKGLISTVQMGRDAGFKGNKLNEWAQRIGFQLNHHDPRSDAYCCNEVYRYLASRPVVQTAEPVTVKQQSNVENRFF